MASQSSLETWQVRFDGGAGRKRADVWYRVASFRFLGVRPADRPRSPRPTTTARRRRRHQLQLLAAPLRRSSGRARQDVTLPKVALTIIGVAPRGFSAKPAGSSPTSGSRCACSPRAARQRPAARYAARQDDVAACVRQAETRSDSGSGGSPGQHTLSGRAGIVLRRSRLGRSPRANFSISVFESSRARAAPRRRATTSPAR